MDNYKFTEYAPTLIGKSITNDTESILDYYKSNHIPVDNTYLETYLNKEAIIPKAELSQPIDYTDVINEKRNIYMDNYIAMVNQFKQPYTMSNTSNLPEHRVINFFVDKGLTREQAAGIAGNLKQESQFNTKILGDNNQSFGLAQWNRSRWDNLNTYAQVNNRDPEDFDTQLEFLWHELQTSEKRALNHLMNTSTVEEAARIFSEKFERPSIPHLEKRIHYARQFYNS